MNIGKPLPPVKKVDPPTQQEIDLLISNWDTYAPAKYRGMLSAVPYGTTDKKARWFYDAERRWYISRAGYIVKPKELREAYLAFKKARNK